MGTEIFEHNEYVPYLSRCLGPSGRRTGKRTAAAMAAGVNPAYLSRVLKRQADFSLEQADRVSDFLGHGEEERRYFLLLVQKERAGSVRLKNYFEDQLERERVKRLTIQNRVHKAQGLTKEDEARYYSHWHYSAIHVLVSIPALQTVEALTAHLNLPRQKIIETLDFLVRTGLADEVGGRYRVGRAHIHLGNDSVQIARHHANWRLKAMAAIETGATGNLHYSGVVTLSKADIAHIKENLLRTLEETLKAVRHSDPEQAYSYNFDFFRI
jgi:uncharacterized protein (TIGR02147 family)